MNGTVVLEQDGKTILINDVEVEDENIYHFLASIDESRRIDGLVSAIRIGAIGLRRMAVGEEVDYVRKEFGDMVHEFDKMFNPDVKTSHLGKLSKLLGEYFDKGGTLENLFNPAIEGSPLYNLKKELQGELKNLRDSIERKEAKEEIVQITTLKGYAFEDACEAILSDFVSKHIGDELERTTSKHGEITGSLAGDFLITLRDMPDTKIVLETKDWGSVTQPKIIEGLEEAMTNRAAKYGIFVSKYKEALPKKIGWFNEFRGNMLICALGSKEADTFFPEVLNIAYQWARLKLTKEIPPGEKALETIAEGIKEIATKLDAFTQIQRQCTNVETATQEIRKLSDKLKSSIATQIDKIKQAITYATGVEIE
ncbi:MAG: hypothetical protein WB564_00775 [Dehalococcoidia bacterium]